MADAFSIARLCIGIGILAAAAASDWKTRQVSNKAWLLMGTLGIVLMAVEMLRDETVLGMNGFEPAHFLIFIPIAILFYDVFWDREPVYDGKTKKVNFLPIMLYVIALASILCMIYLEGFTRDVVHLLTVPSMILIAILFYFVGLLHGGADAKAFMSLAILFPIYPVINGMPLLQASGFDLEDAQIAFPFAFLVLMWAALAQVLTVPLAMLAKNLAKGDRGFPEMFLGYKMDIANVPKKFVWPMEQVRDGEVVMVVFPKRGENVKVELAKLREKGLTRIWVTPKVPFMIPMLIGLVLALVIGNFIFLLF
jgi:preflagellin peptidase FlaK